MYVSRNRFAPCTSGDTLIGAFAGERSLEDLLRARGVKVVYPETLALLDQLQIYRDAQVLIVAEGSAQHGLELLGLHPSKQVILLCRRPQRPGMDLPLRVRFPRLQVVQAVTAMWVEQGGVAWNGLAELDWEKVTPVLNRVLDEPFLGAETKELFHLSALQLKQLKKVAPLVRQAVG